MSIVQLPEHVYMQAQSLAAERGMSVAEVIAQALRHELEGDHPAEFELTGEQAAELMRAQEDALNRRVFSAEQVAEEMRAYRLSKSPDQS